MKDRRKKETSFLHAVSEILRKFYLKERKKPDFSQTQKYGLLLSKSSFYKSKCQLHYIHTYHVICFAFPFPLLSLSFFIYLFYLSIPSQFHFLSILFFKFSNYSPLLLCCLAHSLWIICTLLWFSPLSLVFLLTFCSHTFPLSLFPCICTADWFSVPPFPHRAAFANVKLPFSKEESRRLLFC